MLWKFGRTSTWNIEICRTFRFWRIKMTFPRANFRAGPTVEGLIHLNTIVDDLRWKRVFTKIRCVRCVLRQEWGIQFFDTCSINNARHHLSAICSRVLHVNVSRCLIDNYMEISRTSFRARLWFFGRWLVRSEDVSFRSENKYVRKVAARGGMPNTV